MKPIVDIDYNKIFVNTKFHDELSAVIFGAELALEYANIPQAHSRDIKDTIVRSAFESFYLDYIKMASAARAQGVTISAGGPAADLTPPEPDTAADLTPSASANAPDLPISAPSPGVTVSSAAPVKDMTVSAAAAAPNVTVSAAALPEAPGLTSPKVSGYDYVLNAPAVTVNAEPGSVSYQAPPVNAEYRNAGAVAYPNADGGYEQTVVYENYPDPTKTAAPENIRSNIWGEPVVRQDDGENFGKIHWTTYSTGDDQASGSFGQGDTENK